MNRCLLRLQHAVQEPVKAVEVQAPKIEPEVKAETKKPMSIDDIKGTPEYEEMKQMLTDYSSECTASCRKAS